MEGALIYTFFDLFLYLIKKSKAINKVSKMMFDCALYLTTSGFKH